MYPSFETLSLIQRRLVLTFQQLGWDGINRVQAFCMKNFTLNLCRMHFFYHFFYYSETISKPYGQSLDSFPLLSCMETRCNCHSNGVRAVSLQPSDAIARGLSKRPSGEYINLSLFISPISLGCAFMALSWLPQEWQLHSSAGCQKAANRQSERSGGRIQGVCLLTQPSTKALLRQSSGSDPTSILLERHVSGRAFSFHPAILAVECVAWLLPDIPNAAADIACFLFVGRAAAWGIRE